MEYSRNAYISTNLKTIISKVTKCIDFTTQKGGPLTCMLLPGSFLGFLKGTNFAPIASAIGGPKKKPLASTPMKKKKIQIFYH